MHKILEVLIGKKQTLVCEKNTERGSRLIIYSGGKEYTVDKFEIAFPRNCFSESDIMYITIDNGIEIKDNSTFEIR